MYTFRAYQLALDYQFVCSSTETPTTEISVLKYVFTYNNIEDAGENLNTIGQMHT